MADIVTDISRNKNWNARKGVNNPFTITFTSGGSAFNISGYTFSLQVRNFGSSTNLVSLTQGSGLTNNGAAGTLTGNISAANLTSLSANDYYWQLTVVQPDTYTYVLLQGRFSLFEETYAGDPTSSVTVNVSLTGSNVAVSLTMANSTLPRVYSVSSTATLTVNVDSYDQANVTAQAEALTIANPTGTPSDGQRLVISIKDDGTPRTISYGSQFDSISSILPNITSETIYLFCTWNTVQSKWFVYQDSSGGSSTPGGSDTQVQFNDGGSFGGDAGFVYNKNTNVGTIGGLNVSGLTASELVATDGSKNLQSLAVATYPSLTEVSYVKGLTGAIQPQLDSKWSLNSGGTLTGANTITGSTTNTITFYFPSLGVADYKSFVLENSTAATLGSQQKSPTFILRGQGWKTNSTASSQSVEYMMDVLPVQGAAAPTFVTRKYSSINNGAKSPIGFWDRSDGVVIFGPSPSSENVKIYGTNTNDASNIVNGAAGTFWGYTASTGVTYPQFIYGFSGTNGCTSTAGEAVMINYNGRFIPTSGNANWTVIGTTITINQTGGASGLVRIFNPTVNVTAGTSLTGYYWNPTNPNNLTGNNISFHAVSGNMLLPASSYLNLGSTVGSSGYGIRESTNIQVKHSGGSWNDITSGSLGLTDNTIPRVDGTTGNLLQSSGVTISDTDVVTALGYKQGGFTSGSSSYQTQQSTLGGYGASSTGFVVLSNPSDYANNTVLYVEFTAVLIKSDGTASVSATVQSRFRKNNSGTWTADAPGTAVTSDATVLTTFVGDINGGVPGVTWTSGAFAGTYAGGFSSKITAYTY